MGELVWALVVLLWNLAQLAGCVWIVFGFLTGRLVWLSRDEVVARRRDSS